MAAGKASRAVATLVVVLEADRADAGSFAVSLEGIHRVVLGRGERAPHPPYWRGDRARSPDRRASKPHAALERMGDGFVITDLGSSNGTFVGGFGASERVTESAVDFDQPFRVGHPALDAAARRRASPRARSYRSSVALRDAVSSRSRVSSGGSSASRLRRFPFFCWGKWAPAKRCWRAPSTSDRRGPAPSSPSTAEPCRRTSSRRTSSVTSKAPSPERRATRSVSCARPITGRSSSTKSAISR